MNINTDESVHLEHMHLRTAAHKRNPKLDQLLAELEQLLGPVEQALLPRFSQPQHPVLFLVGVPRSGSTAFMQFLQRTACFAVPTNVMARFYYAPYIGAKIQQLLFNPEYDFRGELAWPGSSPEAQISSSLGKTSGPLQASEILHFWRRFLPHYDPQHIGEADESQVDTRSIAAELAAMENVFEKPLALKGGMLQSCMRLLLKCAQPAFVVFLRRDPFFIAQSILKAREDHYGRRDVWWSFKPKEYDGLKTMDVYHQIAGQVYYGEQIMCQQIEIVPGDQRLMIDYEQFCERPANVFRQIVDWYGSRGLAIDPVYRGPAELICGNRVRVNAEDERGLRDAYQDFSTGAIRLQG